MTAQYISLDRLGHREDFSSTGHSNRHVGTGWRLPKRPASAVIVACAFLAALYHFFGASPSAEATQQSLLHPTPSELSPYLLGETEDVTKLWFPPKSDGGQFEPPVAPYNSPPAISQRPRTPLFIAFTRNNAMLQQAVLSYIAGGWPREDIIVVDNSGTMDANPLHQLSPKNPFFLDYDLFRRRYGVSILQTPTLLTFAQLMNFYLRLSMAYNWRYFFWSHMDVAILADEDAQPYKSFYGRVLDILADLGIASLNAGSDHSQYNNETWALKYFAYDWLTLINVPAWRKVGAWDTFIPYYATDCDAYSRIVLNGLTKDDVRAGRVFDLSGAIKDPESKFFSSWTAPAAATGEDGLEKPGSPRYRALLEELQDVERHKPENHRNVWQGANAEGKGEAWTYDPDGFQKMWWSIAEKGREMYRMKWGTSECRLDEHGVKLDDAWVQHKG